MGLEKKKLLIIEDDESVRAQMKWALSEDYAVLLAGGKDTALAAIASEAPSVVTLDLGLPPCPHDFEIGLSLLGRILDSNPLSKVIVVTGNGERAAALRAISMGAHDLLTKPVNIAELKTVLKRAYIIHAFKSEYSRLKEGAESPAFGAAIGPSPLMQGVFSTIRKISLTDIPVLITGESGTGKELVARAIHEGSLRKDRPFVPINCGAIPETLLESELFGHEKGAFTGAHIQRCGRIESARGGTLFLDEIAELPLQLQVKMLRFLQDHRIERVGGRSVHDIDVRVIAATNGDIKKLAGDGRFREDLYYRLAVVTIELPPLRDRGEDAITLAESFLRKFSPDSRQRALSPEAVNAVRSYPWPGNVRELENRTRRAITFSEGPVITPADLGFCAPGDGLSLDVKKAKEEIEARLVRIAVLKHRGNISRAAEELGLSRPTVHQIIRKYNMNEAARKG